MLSDARDPNVAKTAPSLVTGRKLTLAAAAHAAKSALKLRDIVGNVNQGRGGLGLWETQLPWYKATWAQQRGLVVEEICR